MRDTYKNRLIVKRSSNAPLLIKASKKGTFVWKKPYYDVNVDSIDTGLTGNFRYSPVFRNCYADTYIELTGSRRKDYKIAEKMTGVTHIPRVSVWHHVWQEKNGLFRIQLVDFVEHKKTCPHAGGCYLWVKKHGKNRYRACRGNTNMMNVYNDIPKPYLIASSDRRSYQNGYVSKKTMSKINRKKATLVGIDAYGNLFYKNKNAIYYWDHELDCLINIGNNIGLLN